MANWLFNQLINKFIGLHWPCSALSGRSSRWWFCLGQNRPFQRLLRRWDLTRRTPSPGVVRRSWNGAGKWSQSVWSATHSGQRHPLIDPRPLSPWRIWSKGNYLIIVLITFVSLSPHLNEDEVFKLGLDFEVMWCNRVGCPDQLFLRPRRVSCWIRPYKLYCDWEEGRREESSIRNYVEVNRRQRVINMQMRS